MAKAVLFFVFPFIFLVWGGDFFTDKIKIQRLNFVVGFERFFGRK